MGRAAIALFIIAFFAIFIAFWTGIAGCWRRSPGNITATALLILLACKLFFIINPRIGSSFSLLSFYAFGTLFQKIV